MLLETRVSRTPHPAPHPLQSRHLCSVGTAPAFSTTALLQPCAGHWDTAPASKVGVWWER